MVQIKQKTVHGVENRFQEASRAEMYVLYTDVLEIDHVERQFRN